MFSSKKPLASPPVVPPAPPSAQKVDNLSHTLMALNKVGAPRLRWSAAFESWHATIEMFTSVAGASIDVKSEYGHKTPDAAVQELHERVVNALRFLGRDMP